MIPELTEVQVKEMEIELLKERLRISDLKNKELKEQLRLHVVGCSLPSEEELTSEIVDYIGINKLTKGTMLTERQCLAFEIGFRKCYGWLMKR